MEWVKKQKRVWTQQRHAQTRCLARLARLSPALSPSIAFPSVRSHPVAALSPRMAPPPLPTSPRSASAVCSATVRRRRGARPPGRGVLRELRVGKWQRHSSPRGHYRPLSPPVVGAGRWAAAEVASYGGGGCGSIYCACYDGAFFFQARRQIRQREGGASARDPGREDVPASSSRSKLVRQCFPSKGGYSPNTD